MRGGRERRGWEGGGDGEGGGEGMGRERGEGGRLRGKGGPHLKFASPII